MTKIMLLIGCLSSFVLFEPDLAIRQLGPQASWLGWKISSALPAIGVFGRR